MHAGALQRLYACMHALCSASYIDSCRCSCLILLVCIQRPYPAIYLAPSYCCIYVGLRRGRQHVLALCYASYMHCSRSIAPAYCCISSGLIRLYICPPPACGRCGSVQALCNASYIDCSIFSRLILLYNDVCADTGMCMWASAYGRCGSTCRRSVTPRT